MTMDGEESDTLSETRCGEVVTLDDMHQACCVVDCKGMTEGIPTPAVTRVHPSTSHRRDSIPEVSPLYRLALNKVARQVVLCVMKEDDRRHDTYKDVGSWLARLGSLVDAVVWRVQETRPPWLPIDLHWIEVEPDPLLLLLARVPCLRTLTYTPVPQALPALTALLCGLPALTHLQLRHTADDALLRMVGRSCPALRVFCVKGARSVSDSGVRRLLLRPAASSRCAWRFLYRRLREARPSLPGAQYRPLPPLPPPIPAHQRTELTSSLRHLDLRGTKVSPSGAAWAARCVPHAHLVLLSSTVTQNVSSRTRRYHSLEEHHQGSSPHHRRPPPSP